MEINSKVLSGHIAAILTIIIWGTTFISTKILLTDFKPIEILFFRFVLGLSALIIIYPKRLKSTTKKQELTFAAAGLFGVTLYYLLENIALTYTTASNVGVIISVSPFFIAILSKAISGPSERLSINFFIGFAAAMVGICIISFGNSKFESNPFGDLPAVAAALIWAIYSLLSKKISRFGFNTIQTTRRIFTYGIIFMIPFLFIFDFKFELARFSDRDNLINILFLGLCASALCFVTWNFAVKHLGAVKTGVYIYTVPVITVVASVLILKEQFTLSSIIGTVLILAGLILSEIKFDLRKQKRGNNNEY